MRDAHCGRSSSWHDGLSRAMCGRRSNHRERTGTLSSVDELGLGCCAQAAFGFTVAEGDPFTFRFSFDGVSVDQSTDPTFVVHFFDSSRVTIKLGTRTAYSGPLYSFHSAISDGSPQSSFAEDAIFLFGYVPNSDLGFILAANDPLGRWLSTDALPAELAATLNAAPQASLTMTYPTEEGEYDSQPVRYISSRRGPPRFLNPLRCCCSAPA